MVSADFNPECWVFHGARSYQLLESCGAWLVSLGAHSVYIVSFLTCGIGTIWTRSRTLPIRQLLEVRSRKESKKEFGAKYEPN